MTKYQITSFSRLYLIWHSCPVEYRYCLKKRKSWNPKNTFDLTMVDHVFIPQGEDFGI